MEEKATKVESTHATTVAQTIRIDRDAKAKTLSIEMDHRKPTYRFDGLWGGGDINVILRGLRRAYFAHTRELRRTNQATFDKGESDA